MTAVAEQVSSYLASYADLEAEFPDRSESPIRGVRRAALDAFARNGFPTSRDEDWLHTSLLPLTRIAFSRAPVYHAGLVGLSEMETLERSLFGLSSPIRMVFVDGQYASDLSDTRSLPARAYAGSLAAAMDGGLEGSNHWLTRVLSCENHPFAALNTALMQDGAVIDIPSGVVVDTPVHLLYLASGERDSVMVHPRNLITMGANSQATVIEAYAGLRDGVYLTNTASEIALGENAGLEYIRLQEESQQAFHISSVQAHQESGSRLSTHSFCFGGSLVRNDVRTVLSGGGAHVSLNGLYIARDRQHIDNHTFIDHASPNCQSRERYHGILDDHARGVFCGRVLVRPDAQKTDAQQTNRNLLLSDQAQVDTRPQLEILADDVKCTHGATVGQLDEESIFYLRSRGIDLESARGLLTYAFASEIVNGVGVASLKEQLQSMLFERLSGENHPKEEV